MSTPTFRWSVRGIIENLDKWIEMNPTPAITVAICAVLIATMFIVVARWDRRNNRNRRL